MLGAHHALTTLGPGTLQVACSYVHDTWQSSKRHYPRTGEVGCNIYVAKTSAGCAGSCGEILFMGTLVQVAEKSRKLAMISSVRSPHPGMYLRYLGI